jgi:hypothetical protein
MKNQAEIHPIKPSGRIIRLIGAQKPPFFMDLTFKAVQGLSS